MSRRKESIASLRQRLARGELDDLELEGLATDPRAGVRVLVERSRRAQLRRIAERTRLEAMTTLESDLWNRGILRVAGVDEVGAGALAGPVMAAAVVLPPGWLLEGVDDSKKVAPRRRELLAEKIRAGAVAWAVGRCEVEEIDRLNIFQAARRAMQRAVEGLGVPAQYLLVDARSVPGVGTPQSAIVDGDARSLSIAAASIVAKVERDAYMLELAQRYRGYGFERNRGYGTADHFDGLRRHGPCPEHRRSFGPVAATAGSDASP